MLRRRTLNPFTFDLQLFAETIIHDSEGEHHEGERDEDTFDVGRHEERLNQLDKFTTEMNEWRQELQSQVQGLVDRPTEIPNDLLERVGGLENQLLQIPDRVTEAVTAALENTGRKEAEALAPPTPNNNENSPKKRHPVLAFLHGFA
jgi:hypothetical protein